MTRDEHGMTLVELMVAATILGLVVCCGGFYGINMLRAERQRGAIYQVYAFMNLARVEAAKRNRDCRFTLDTTTRTIQVQDLNDPSLTTDDQTVETTMLPTGIVFGRPDGSPAVSIGALSGTLYGTTFKADGAVDSGAGAVGLWSDETFRRVSVYAGGAVSVERWNGAAWTTGS